MPFSKLIEKLMAGEILTEEEVAQAVKDINSNLATDTQIGSFLVASRMTDQLDGAVLRCQRVMRIIPMLWEDY